MVKLVEYPESSDEEHDDRFNDESQWSSFNEIPSSPTDSFSYQMRSPESDEDDEDYAPSRTSLEASGSVTSSVDTDDLDPDNDMDEELLEEETVDRQEEEEEEGEEGEEEDKEEKSRDVFYAWKDLRAAFGLNAFKRRSMETSDDMEEPATEREEEGKQQTQQFHKDRSTATMPNLFDVEAGRWSFQAAFAPGVVQKKKTRPRRRQTLSSAHPTGVSPRFSTLSTGEQEQLTTAATAAATKEKTEQETNAPVAEEQTMHETQFRSVETLRVEIPSVFSVEAKQTRVETPNFTFGKVGAAEFGQDTHMRSPSPKHPATASGAPVEGGFTLGQSGNYPKPYNFGSGNRALQFATKVSSAGDSGHGTRVHNPRPRSDVGSRNSTNGEFLFGQAYRNRKFDSFSRPKHDKSLNSTEAAHTSTNAAPTKASETTEGANGTSSASFSGITEPSAGPAFFTTGVAGRNMQHRNSDRRKKKTSTTSTTAPLPNFNASSFQFAASTSSFGSPLFHTATAAPQQSDSADNAHEKHSVRSSYSSSATPSQTPFPSTNGSFVFGSSSSQTSSDAFSKTESFPFRTTEFGSASSTTSKTSSASVPGQVLFGNGTSCNPFEFGEAETALPTGGSQFSFPADTATSGGFQIGSMDTQKNSRVRPRRSGMFTHKNSPRKDAKVGATEPEPSPSFCSTSPPTSSPFGLHHRRTRKNARLRKYGRSPPADPFATHTFQSHPSSPLVSFNGPFHPHAVRSTANTSFGSVMGSTAASSKQFSDESTEHQNQANDSGVFSFQTQSSASQSSHASTFQQEEPSEAAKIPQTGTRPAYAGSRRILRAALRGVGVGGDRASSAPPTMGNRSVEGDAEMDSEDERDWLELKRLGGIAHCSRNYEDAAEYYRQSIELLEALLYRDAVRYTTEIRTDKAKLHANRAASLMMLMQISEAQRECQRSIEVDATYARAYLRLGRIQVLLGDAVNAQANINTARQLMEEPDNDNVSRGDQADHASLTKMEATIKKLTMLQNEIKWYIDCGDFKQALVHINSALTLAPNCRKLQVEKARVLLREKQLDQLIDFCTTIIEKQQGSQGKGSSHGSTKEVQTKSLQDKSVANIAIVGLDLGLLWATTLHYQNKVEDAVKVLNALEVVAPCSSHVIQLKRQWQEMKRLKHDGNERFQQGKYQEAIRFYSEAVQIDPQHEEYCAIIYCNRSAAQMGLERYHTAILDCNEALQRKPDFPRALLRRARCHVALNMYHEAMKDFERYLCEQPRNLPVDATADVCRERDEAKAAIAKAREEARQREAAKKRAERQQRQHRSHHWEDSSRTDGRFHDNFRRGASSSNGGGYRSSRFQSSGGASRASFMAPKTQRRTHYDVLGIEKTATNDQIKKSYRKLALVYHPDKAKTSTHADLFKEMTAAYNVLSDESTRAKYDRDLIYNRFGNYYEH